MTFNNQKSSSEIGLHFGNFTISGDVSPQYLKCYGGGLHYRSALNHVVSVRYDFLIAKANGLGANPYKEALVQDDVIFEGYGQDNPYFFSFKTRVISLGADLLFELTNLAPQIKFKPWNIHLGIGFGVYNSDTKLNLKNDNNLPYSDLLNKTSFNIDNDFNTLNGRNAIKSKLLEIYDNSYETPGPKKAGVFRLGNETNIYAYAKVSFGVSRKISRKISIGIEYSAMLSDNDLLDGNRWRTDNDLSNHNDVMHYFNVRLGYNLNNKSNNSTPLFWVNPWDENEEKLKKEKELLDSLYIDTDLDGVADIYDLEKNSLANCPVDRDGIVLDSDKDGKPDCLDSDPYLNEKLLEDKIATIIKQLKEENTNGFDSNNQNKLSLKEYNDIIDSLFKEAYFKSLISKINLLLPEIYFNKNQSAIDEVGHKQILVIVRVLEQNPNVNIKILGHSSNEGSENYNIDLSLERASSIQSFLVNNCKIASNRLQIIGLGSSKARFNSESNFWYLDRKVAFQFY